MAARKPNVLMICSDQQRTDTMGAYGNSWVETPALNDLAGRSHVFENAYVTQPVCSPARATLMTGLYPHSAGVVRNSQPGRPLSNLGDDVKTIAEMAPEEYLCAKYGKWHLGDDLTPQHGFEEWVSTEDAHDNSFPNYVRKEHRFRKSDYHQYLVDRGYVPAENDEGHTSFTQAQRGRFPEQDTMANYLGERTAEFIRRQQHSDRPWLISVMMFEPHPPYDGPLNDLYDPNEIPDGPLFLQKPAANTPLFNRVRSEYHLREIEEERPADPESVWREMRARYYGNVTVLDRGVGMILDALKETGQEEDTVIVFTSDHGDSLGDRGMLNKRSFYEEVARVPLMIHIPGTDNRSTRVSGSIGQIDIVPTLLDLMGAEVPGHLEGMSRVGVLRGEDSLDDDVHMQWHGGPATVTLGSEQVERMSILPWRSIVTPDRWKLNLCPGDQCELYDLNSDPLELVNLFDEPEHRDRVRDMAARIRSWQYSTGDDLALPPV